MLDMNGLRIFLLGWGVVALAVRLVYGWRAYTRKAKPGVDQTTPHPLAVLSMSIWFGVFGALLVFPDTVREQTLSMPFLPYMRITGLGLLAAGLWTLVRAHVALGEFYGVKLYIKQDHRLIDIGPYAHVRHPMYTTYLIWFAAMTLIVPHPVTALVLIMGGYGFYRMAKGEERMLCQALGEPYKHYCRRTGMFLPRM
ncbi:MAG: isoprenylcysteine carboxylmethyltransferase family protein [candidate division Zixibacteria bacterium]|nr:isoprenylcysteine carboxylmethyltransferase family protein [candidate division Zixibacteria bacterium]